MTVPQSTKTQTRGCATFGLLRRVQTNTATRTHSTKRETETTKKRSSTAKIEGNRKQQRRTVDAKHSNQRRRASENPDAPRKTNTRMRRDSRRCIRSSPAQRFLHKPSVKPLDEERCLILIKRHVHAQSRLALRRRAAKLPMKAHTIGKSRILQRTLERHEHAHRDIQTHTDTHTDTQELTTTLKHTNINTDKHNRPT